MLDAIWFNIGENKWIFSCREPQSLTFVCTKQVYQGMIDNGGILIFDHNFKLVACSSNMEINGEKIYNGRNVEILIPHLEEFVHHDLDFNLVYNPNFSVTNFTQLEQTVK